MSITRSRVSTSQIVVGESFANDAEIDSPMSAPNLSRDYSDILKRSPVRRVRLIAAPSAQCEKPM